MWSLTFNDMNMEVGLVQIILETTVESSQGIAFLVWRDPRLFVGRKEDGQVFLLIQIHLKGAQEWGHGARGLGRRVGQSW